MKVLFVIAFIVIFNCAYSQQCKDTSFKISYHVTNAKISLQDQKCNSLGEHFISGSLVFNATPALSDFFIAKINSDGTIGFAKKIGFVNSDYSTNKSLSLILNNSNFVNALNGVGYYEALDSAIKIMVSDASGNLIWAKKYFLPSAAISPVAIKESALGNIVVLFKYADNIDNQTDLKNGLLCLDGAGNIIWAKIYNTTAFTDLQGQSISILGNRIYLKGFFLGEPPNSTNPYEHKLFTAKIDLATGNLIDSKSYQDLRVQDNNVARYFFTNYAEQINTSKNQILCTDRFENALETKFGGIRSIMDTNLAFLKASYFSTSNTYRQTRIVASKDEEIFNYGNIFSGGVLSNVYISKFDSAGFPSREISLNYSTAAGSQYQISPVRPISLIQKYLSVFNTFVQSGDTYLQLYQFPDDVPINDCYGHDTSLIQKIDYPITEVNHPFLTQITSISVSTGPLTVIVTALPIITDKQCTLNSDCGTLHINRILDTICSLKDTVSFDVHKNVECLKHVLWNIDTSAISYFQNFDDTTIRVRFKKQWTGYLYASVNSCSSLKDSIFLHVYDTPDSIALGKDTVLCNGQSVTLHAKPGYKRYLWNNSSTSPDRTVNASGEYSVIAEDYCHNLFYDTIKVRYYQSVLPVNLGHDTTLCTGEILQLHAGNGFRTYLWQDNSSAENFTLTQPGKFYVKAIDSCNTPYTDTIIVSYFINRPAVNLGTDFTYCPNKSTTFNAGDGYKTYMWQDGSTNSHFSANGPGTYSIIVVDSCGNTSHDSIEIYPAENIQFSIEYPKPICSFDTVQIILPTILHNYHISPVENSFITHNNLSLFPEASTQYMVSGTTPAGCMLATTFPVQILDCGQEIYFPTAFTPNGDGLNDYFKGKSTKALAIYNLSVYNRFGQKIFSTKNIHEGWNGMFEGKVQSTGTFIWECHYAFSGDKIQFKKGSFILLR